VLTLPENAIAYHTARGLCLRVVLLCRGETFDPCTSCCHCNGLIEASGLEARLPTGTAWALGDGPNEIALRIMT